VSHASPVKGRGDPVGEVEQGGGDHTNDGTDPLLDRSISGASWSCSVVIGFPRRAVTVVVGRGVRELRIRASSRAAIGEQPGQHPRGDPVAVVGAGGEGGEVATSREQLSQLLRGGLVAVVGSVGEGVRITYRGEQLILPISLSPRD
jgi:hypothetical protein